MEKLLTKRQERDNKQLLEAFTKSEKTLAEVVEFLQGNKTSEERVLKIIGSLGNILVSHCFRVFHLMYEIETMMCERLSYMIYNNYINNGKKFRAI